MILFIIIHYLIILIKILNLIIKGVSIACRTSTFDFQPGINTILMK